MNIRAELAAAYQLILGREPTEGEAEQALAEPGGLEALSRHLQARGVARFAIRQQLERERRRARSLGRRLQQAEQETARWRENAVAARAELAALRNSTTWRVAVGAHDRVPPWARQLARRLWALHSASRPAAIVDASSTEPHAIPPEPQVVVGEVQACRPIALVIENRWPQPDRDSGSIDVQNLVEALLALGYHVIFAADMEHDLASADRDALVARGVRCLSPDDAPSVRAFLQRDGASIALCVLSRVYGGGRFAEDVWRHCPDARVVFNSIDLHFLRAEREQGFRGTAAPPADAVAQVREREEFLVRECDATMVVSSAERDILEARFPEALVVEMPLARVAQPRTNGFAPRNGIGFIGGFAHAPNLDALRWFLAEIWPLILRDMPDCVFSIVGSDLPEETLHGVPGTMRYLGYVPDVAPWFETLRLTVAPIRFGAGAKGKVASSLAAGVPCVTTAVGSEGMRLRNDENVLVAGTAEDFATRVREVHNDPRLWERLSQAGQAHAAAQLSITGWRERLHEMLWVIEALPEQMPAIVSSSESRSTPAVADAGP